MSYTLRLVQKNLESLAEDSIEIKDYGLLDDVLEELDDQIILKGWSDEDAEETDDEADEA